MNANERSPGFTLTHRARSFVFAFRGIGVMLVSQHNAWIHAAATVVVLVAGFAFGLSAAEWCWIVLSVVAVWTAEAINTAFEFLADVAHPDFHPLVERAKDVAAAAVLIAAGGSVAIALLVFGPHIADALRR